MRGEEGRPGERLRLWDKLAALSLELGNMDDAIAALEVARNLAPDDTDRIQRLADLAYATGKHDVEAIAAHHAVLRHKHARTESYIALRSLYERAGQAEKAKAMDDALAVLGRELLKGGIGDLITGKPARAAQLPALTNDEWLANARLDVDLQLSALFAVVAPPFAVERARMRPPIAAPAKETRSPSTSPACCRACSRRSASRARRCTSTRIIRSRGMS